jgi:hypothetical protein
MQDVDQPQTNTLNFGTIKTALTEQFNKMVKNNVELFILTLISISFGKPTFPASLMGLTLVFISVLRLLTLPPHAMHGMVSG